LFKVGFIAATATAAAQVEMHFLTNIATFCLDLSAYNLWNQKITTTDKLYYYVMFDLTSVHTIY
jgi:hypothetical protein